MSIILGNAGLFREDSPGILARTQAREASRSANCVIYQSFYSCQVLTGGCFQRREPSRPIPRSRVPGTPIVFRPRICSDRACSFLRSVMLCGGDHNHRPVVKQIVMRIGGMDRNYRAASCHRGGGASFNHLNSRYTVENPSGEHP